MSNSTEAFQIMQEQVSWEGFCHSVPLWLDKRYANFIADFSEKRNFIFFRDCMLASISLAPLADGIF